MNSSDAPLLRRHLPIHTGKYLFELTQTRPELPSNLEQKTFFVISREEVEQGDISRFLSTFGLHNSVESLRSLQGKTLFLINGYEDHPDPLFTIPEVRTFFAKCHKSWPCWNFFADLDTHCLTMIVCCVIPNLTSLRLDCAEVDVTLHDKGVYSFFVGGLATAAYLHHKLGTDRFTGAKLLRKVADYLE